jgi:hypothetical protein
MKLKKTWQDKTNSNKKNKDKIRYVNIIHEDEIIKKSILKIILNKINRDQKN